MSLEAECQQAELRRAFDVFDLNHDGLISQQEFTELSAKLDMKLPEEEVISILNSVDQNGDGVVDFKEFNSLYLNESFTDKITQQQQQQEQEEDSQENGSESQDSQAELKEAFDVFDKDKDGFITSLELHNVLCSLGLQQGHDMVQIKTMIRSVDADGDGKVNFKEFKAMMSKALTM